MPEDIFTQLQHHWNWTGDRMFKDAMDEIVRLRKEVSMLRDEARQIEKRIDNA